MPQTNRLTPRSGNKSRMLSPTELEQVVEAEKARLHQGAIQLETVVDQPGKAKSAITPEQITRIVHRVPINPDSIVEELDN